MSNKKYRVTIVAVGKEGFADLDSYAEEFEFVANPNHLGLIVAQCAALEAGIDPEEFMLAHVTRRTSEKLDSLL